MIEVHRSYQLACEIHSVTAVGANGAIMGFGHDTCLIGLDVALRLIAKKKKANA